MILIHKPIYIHSSSPFYILIGGKGTKKLRQPKAAAAGISAPQNSMPVTRG